MVHDHSFRDHLHNLLCLPTEHLQVHDEPGCRDAFLIFAIYPLPASHVVIFCVNFVDKVPLSIGYSLNFGELD